jgi:hypothetical protein
MLVLATFLAISMAAVLLMLRFIFALDSEIRAAKKHSAATVHFISGERSPSASGARDSSPLLTLVDSNARRRTVYAPVSRSAYFQRNENSESKGA